MAPVARSVHVIIVISLQLECLSLLLLFLPAVFGQVFRRHFLFDADIVVQLLCLRVASEMVVLA